MLPARLEGKLPNCIKIINFKLKEAIIMKRNFIAALLSVFILTIACGNSRR